MVQQQPPCFPSHATEPPSQSLPSTHLPSDSEPFKHSLAAPVLPWKDGAPSESRRPGNTRAARACEGCRFKKVKCDEGRPSCGYCIAKGLECRYSNLPPPVQDTFLVKVLKQLEQLKSENSEKAYEAVNDVLNKAFAVNDPPDSSSYREPNSIPRISKTRNNIPASAILSHPTCADHKLTAAASSATETTVSRNDCPGDSCRLGHDDHRSAAGSCSPFAQGEPAIPFAYIAASRDPRSWIGVDSFTFGIRWEDIEAKEMTHHFDPSLDANYYVTQNSEGCDTVFGKSSRPRMLHESANWGDATNSGAARATLGRPNITEYPPVEQISPGGRTASQSLFIAESTVSGLCNIYIDQVHGTHPFLNIARVMELTKAFVDDHEPDTLQAHSPYTAESEANRSNSNYMATSCRVAQTEGVKGTSAPLSGTKACLRCTVDEALVLLILAVGKLCFHQCLSASKDERIFSESPFSHSAQLVQWTLDIDRVPGAAYFSTAVSILAETYGGNTVLHVQAQLLAGIYLSQLGHVYDASQWIHAACVTWLMLFKDYDEDVDRLNVDEGLSFFACVVMESDIMADLEAIPSAIAYWGNAVDSAAYDADPQLSESLAYYRAEFNLRKILKGYHNACDNTQRAYQGPHSKWGISRTFKFVDQLETWRASLPSYLQWQDKPTKARSVRSARLRADFWDIKSIILRSFLYRAIDIGTRRRPETGLQTSPELRGGNDSTDPLTLSCVEAIKRSSESFDDIFSGASDCAVVNPFRAAQSQFENILLLSAICRSMRADSFFSVPAYHALLCRTVRYLTCLRFTSPTMETNRLVLERVEGTIFDYVNRQSPD